MIPSNRYPVSFKDFKVIKSTGGYIVYYCILDDRIHFEMPIENAVIVSQQFLEDIEIGIINKAMNYKNDKIEVFLKMTLNDVTFYKYYPTREIIRELKQLKLYKELIVKEIVKGVYNKKYLKIFESDQLIKAYNGNKLVMKAEKQK